nr:hypothetical protein [Pedobacter sp. ASV2]
MMEEKLKILLLEEVTLFRLGLKTLISAYWTSVRFLPEGTSKCSLDDTPHVVIMGIISSHKSAGISQLKKMLQKFPLSKILIFSLLDEQLYALPYLKNGAAGYLSKNADESKIIDAIETVLKGELFYCSQELKAIIFNDLISNNLSERDKRMLFRRKMYSKELA